LLIYTFYNQGDKTSSIMDGVEDGLKLVIPQNSNVRNTCGICNNVQVSSVWFFWDTSIPYHNSSL